MSKRDPVIINGRRVGRIKAGWLLTKETWRFLRADSEMILIPLIGTLINLLLFGLVVGIFVVVLVSSGTTITSDDGTLSMFELAFIFSCYIIGAFSLAIAEAGITHTVYTRTKGGDATLGESLKTAFTHSGSLFMWAVVTSTVGLILRLLAERSRLLGRIVTALVGAAWSIITYFVVPAIVIDKQPVFPAIGRSGHTFKSTWGETLVSNISIGVIFGLIHIFLAISFFGLAITAVVSELFTITIALIVLYILIVIVLTLIQSAMNGILKTLLYIYATQNELPANFNGELLQQMLSRTNPAQPTTTVPQQPQQM